MPPLPAGSTLPFNDGSVDYFDLWQLDAAWPQAASKVGLFKIYASWVMNSATPEQLRLVVEGVAAKHMALGLEIGAFYSDKCGAGIEGFDAGIEPLDRIRDAGGRVDVISYDEPYAFGVRDPSPNACHWTVQQAATETVRFVRDLRNFDPNILIGDTEPMWQGITPAEIGIWLDAYAQSNGRPLAFIQLDADWALTDWPTVLKATEHEARARAVPVAPIYNGGEASSDAEWADLTMARAVTYEQVIGGRPDFVTLQSWMAHPDHVLPETDPTTFTGLVDRYLAPRPALEVSGAEAAGPGQLDVGVTLSTADGAPIDSATVSASLTPLEFVRQALSIDNVVPEGATTAVVGIRVNVEGAGPDQIDLRVYGLNYAEGGEVDNLINNPRFSNGLNNWGVDGSGQATLQNNDDGAGKMLRLRAAPDRWILVNSIGFPVTAGSTYHFEIAAKPQLANSAYAAVMFLDSTTEIRRDRIVLVPGAIQAGSRETDPLGRALFNLSGAAGTYRLRVDYPGDLDHWPATLEQDISIQ